MPSILAGDTVARGHYRTRNRKRGLLKLPGLLNRQSRWPANNRQGASNPQALPLTAPAYTKPRRYLAFSSQQEVHHGPLRSSVRRSAGVPMLLLIAARPAAAQTYCPPPVVSYYPAPPTVSYYVRGRVVLRSAGRVLLCGAGGVLLPVAGRVVVTPRGPYPTMRRRRCRTTPRTGVTTYYRYGPRRVRATSYYYYP